MGATGILNALDATTGARIWTRNAESDTGASRPDWGFAASPVVVGDLVVTAASGRLVAYELATGTPRWTTRTSAGGYSSPHPATLAGVPQILMQNGGGITSVGLDGTILWANHSEDGGMAIVQPQVLADGSVLTASAVALRGLGVRRLAVSRAADGTWKVEERWRSVGLKPYFSDFVVHKGHAYGFDGTILSAINLETGERVWKGGRYGAGQMILLPEQDLLLVVSEEGDLVLVKASPDQHAEIAKFKAIEGKTWNHPVLVGDLLLVRNGEEMAAFRLPR
jgi:outer membrane protein assembly factor BamB